MELILKNNLEKLALKHKLSLTKMSELSGVPISTLSRVFSGKIKKPTQATVDQIADFFKVSAHLLLSRDIDSKFEEEFKHVNTKSRLLYLMKKHAITSVDELSLMCDVPVSTLKSILYDDSEKLRLDTCYKLSEFFNITIAQLRCEEDLSNSNTNSFVSVPVIRYSDFEKWNSELANKKYVKKYQDYFTSDEQNYFMLEIDKNSKLTEFDERDIFVFIKKYEAKSNGKYLCKINNEIKISRLYFEEDGVYYKLFSTQNKIKYDNVVVYGELVEVKINLEKDK